MKCPRTANSLEPLRRTPNLVRGLLIALAWQAHTAMAGTLSIIGGDRYVRVAHIIDGDTFVTKRGEKVRLLGINTPEIMHDEQPGEALGDAARARLAQLIAGHLVRLAFDRDKRDDYGRLLAQVYDRGRWINAQLVEEGIAHVYTFAPNFRWAPALLQRERQARRLGLGIWRTSRFMVLSANRLRPSHLGQFRLVQGTVTHAARWRFRLGKLHVSVPRKYRAYFGHGLTVKHGARVLVRGKLRLSRQGTWFLALHTPFDLEVE
ncbi:MAG: nuclease [Zetaproteobacteria bacterium]|nr:MAG: nuclease [Zetaproteobacteria bacterium]